MKLNLVGYDGKLILTDLQGDITGERPSLTVARHRDKVVNVRSVRVKEVNNKEFSTILYADRIQNLKITCQTKSPNCLANTGKNSCEVYTFTF